MKKYCYKILQHRIEFHPNSLLLYFFSISGPTSSPVNSLCLSCEPSQAGNVLECQHLQLAALVRHKSSMFTSFTTLGFFLLYFKINQVILLLLLLRKEWTNRKVVQVHRGKAITKAILKLSRAIPVTLSGTGSCFR